MKRLFLHRKCLRKRMALGKAFLNAQRGLKTQLGPTSGQLGPNLAPTWFRNWSQKAPQDLKIWRANIVTETDCNFDPKIIASVMIFDEFCDCVRSRFSAPLQEASVQTTCKHTVFLYVFVVHAAENLDFLFNILDDFWASLQVFVLHHLYCDELWWVFYWSTKVHFSCVARA